MRAVLVPCAVALMFITIASCSAQEAETDLQKMQGEWVCMALIADGRELPVLEGSMTLRIEEDQLHIISDGIVRKTMTIEVDESTMPKQLKSTREKPARAAEIGEDGKPVIIEGAEPETETVTGIYRFTDEGLEFCMPNTPETETPTEFESTERSNLGLIKLTKKEPEAEGEKTE